MKAGHYENDKESVDIMIRTSLEVVKDLVSYGARFERNEDGSLSYTKEGAHSTNRIIFHEDVTGKEITSSLLRGSPESFPMLNFGNTPLWLTFWKKTTIATVL